MELNDALNDPAAFVAAYAERVADLALFSVDFGGLVSGGESWVNASAEEREEGRKILVDATAVAVAVLLGDLPPAGVVAVVATLREKMTAMSDGSI